jgi:hypothetical protein
VRDRSLAAVLAGLGAGIIIIAIFVLANPLGLPNRPIVVNSTKPTYIIISQSEAEAAARDHLDKIAQNNGEQPGIYRGGNLGSADLIYVDKDGTNYLVETPGGPLKEKLPYPIDGSRPNQYIWKITLNVGNTTKPEYIYAVAAQNGTAWMIGVID